MRVAGLRLPHSALAFAFAFGFSVNSQACPQVTPPIGKDPLLGLPTPVPLPRLERLYFKCALLGQCCESFSS